MCKNRKYQFATADIKKVFNRPKRQLPTIPKFECVSNVYEEETEESCDTP